MNLTKRQKEILNFIREYRDENGISPRFIVVNDDPQSCPRRVPLLLVDPARLVEMAGNF